jgi:hypothetical protein
MQYEIDNEKQRYAFYYLEAEIKLTRDVMPGTVWSEQAPVAMSSTTPTRVWIKHASHEWHVAPVCLSQGATGTIRKVGV